MADQIYALEVFLLGPPEVRVAARRLVFPTRKTLALLAYLALADGPQPREQLAALFWPEAEAARSRASLRNTLGHLQTALRAAQPPDASSALLATHTTVGLNPDTPLALDVHTVERAYARARADRASRATPAAVVDEAGLQAALAAYRGDFLAGFSLGDAPAFDDWADVQREAWRRRMGLILDRLSEVQFAKGALAATTETAAAWISLDALNEGAYRRKMRAHFAAGERGQALETYAACRSLLAAELHAEPDPATESLAERIRTQPTPDQPLPQPPSVDTPLAFLGGLFAGRVAEQAALGGALARAAAGQAQMVVLRGEAGIGKTQLAARFLGASAPQAEVLLGGAFESGSFLPFQPVAQAVRGWLAREVEPQALIGDAVLAGLSPLLPELRTRYPALPATTGAEHSQLFEAVGQLTLALAQRAPLIMFVDDLQWADSATLDLLHYLVRRWREARARALLLISLRPESLRTVGSGEPGGLVQWFTRIEREVAPLSLDLGPLPRPETVALVQSCLAPPAPDFAQWLYDETHGHPFYLVETLKDLLERGALHAQRRAAGQWVFAVDADHELGQAVRVPSTVGAVVRARLNRLSPNAFALLAAGATLERGLTFARLAATANVAEDAALPALDELISSRLLIEAVAPTAAGAYSFPNDMVRDVVYTEAGDARRRLFHRRALAVLSAANDPAALLAYHALVAGQAEAAFRFSLAAGEAALRLDASGEAVVHLEHARATQREAALTGVALAADLPRLYRLLGQAYELDGQPGPAQAMAAEAAQQPPQD